jgi:hypothetical protein
MFNFIPTKSIYGTSLQQLFHEPVYRINFFAGRGIKNPITTYKAVIKKRERERERERERKKEKKDRNANVTRVTRGINRLVVLIFNELLYQCAVIMRG